MPPSKLLFRVQFKRLSDNSKQYVFSENVETIINTYVPLKSKVDLEYLASLDIQGPLNYNAAIRKKICWSQVQFLHIFYFFVKSTSKI